MNFLANGGDNYPKLADKKSYTDSGYMINAAMKELVESQKVTRSSFFEELAAKTVVFR